MLEKCSLRLFLPSRASWDPLADPHVPPAWRLQRSHSKQPAWLLSQVEVAQALTFRARGVGGAVLRASAQS